MYITRKDFNKLILKNFDCYKTSKDGKTQHLFVSYLNEEDYERVLQYLKQIYSTQDLEKEK